MLQNANRHGRPNVVEAGKFVTYGNAIFYRSANGKLTTVSAVKPRVLAFFGKVTVNPNKDNR